MTQATATNFVEEAVEAWDLYCAGQYNKILEDFDSHDSNEVRDIRLLAGMETDTALSGPQDIESTSIFTPLLQAMHAYHAGDYQKSSDKLGQWLLGKNFFSVDILQRFSDAAEKAKNYHLLFNVARKYIEWKQYHPVIAAPLFDAAYSLGKHEEAIALWQKFNKHLTEATLVQKAAFCMIQIGRYSDAEKILLEAYKNVHGSPYRMDYETTAKRYEASIRRIPELEKSLQKGDFDSGWELGMAYLFNRQYEKAATVLQSLKTDNS